MSFSLASFVLVWRCFVVAAAVAVGVVVVVVLRDEVVLFGGCSSSE